MATPAISVLLTDMCRGGRRGAGAAAARLALRQPVDGTRGRAAAVSADDAVTLVAGQGRTAAAARLATGGQSELAR